MTAGTPAPGTSSPGYPDERAAEVRDEIDIRSVFSAESEQRVHDRVVGDRRHGLRPA